MKGQRGDKKGGREGGRDSEWTYRYSFNVVAPMQRNSPRASMGFKRFAASMAPSARPAPRTRWISSAERKGGEGGREGGMSLSWDGGKEGGREGDREGYVPMKRTMFPCASLTCE